MTHDFSEMELFRKARVTVLVGAFGSGKTELAINFAMRMNDAGREVALVDIDILKPMFRSRDKRRHLSEKGIRVVSSVADYEDADIPALSPAIYGVIEDESLDVVIDVGGDDDGARILGRFRNVLERAGYEMLYVVNTRRPFSSTPEDIANMVLAVEEASRLKCTALVSNTNLGSESSVELAKEGLDITQQAAETLRIPVRFAVIEKGVADSSRADLVNMLRTYGVPALEMERTILPPWEGIAQS
ncbi:MAG: hypothetical protein PHP20_00280 [Firmicutes bacterium]|nr:hypothetical protein [Bacillota bacterium]MDD4336989.1 hypothetical protein [Bacillota bacterium]MDD4791489.1 hypothetical protein [Bacillota bacterium]